MTEPMVEAVAVSSRRTAAAVALSTGSVLALAAWLEPAVSGHGTHTQLGLPPCTFLTLSGFPCPMCGATTSFALMAHGRWLTAFINQPFAAVLFLCTLIAFAGSTAELIQPRARGERFATWFAAHEVMVAGGLLGGMVVGWAWKVASMWA